MIFASVTQFHVHLLWVNDHLSIVSVLNEKVLVGAFNEEKALVGAFSVNFETSNFAKVRFQLYWTLDSDTGCIVDAAGYLILRV